MIGDIEGKEVILLDDMIDTAGSITSAANALKGLGAVRVEACATHGILSGPAIQRLMESDIERVVVTDTIPMQERLDQCSKLRVVSVAPLLGEAIRRIKTNASISRLFKESESDY